MADFSAPLTRHLWPPGGAQPDQSVFALLDAARDPQIYRTITNSDQPHTCLYAGSLSLVEARTAPYLIELQEYYGLTQWLLRRGWGNSWGVLLRSAVSLVELRSHFRKFLIVQTEDRKRLYFRFYDPRVLRVYLPTCNESELNTFFGPVASYYIEGDAGEMIEFSFAGGKLAQNVVSLGENEYDVQEVERFLRFGNW